MTKTFCDRCLKLCTGPVASVTVQVGPQGIPFKRELCGDCQALLRIWIRGTQGLSFAPESDVTADSTTLAATDATAPTVQG